MKNLYVWCVGAALAAGSAFAAPSEHLNFGTQINAGECTTDRGKLVINVV